MKTNFGFSSSKINLVLRAEKKNFANANSVLIDDMMKNVKEFEENGGIGVHHTSAANTIKQLKKIGFK